jgi:formate/nitrite transporter
MANETQLGSIDAYTPAEMAYRVQSVGTYKAGMSVYRMVMLGVLAGAFISLGAMNYLNGMAQGLPKLVSSTLFCLGLVLCIVGGAELFTSNNLIAMAWAQGKVPGRALLRNWFWIYFSNTIGCLGTVGIAYASGILHTVDLSFGAQVLKVATTKTGLPASEIFFKGILCNVLVCLGVWLCFAARSVTDRIVSLLLPISAFVSMGFEHCIANMFFLPLGFLAAQDPAVVAASHLAPEVIAHLTADNFVKNIVMATLGNILGGSVFVGGMYYMAYLRDDKGMSSGAIMTGFFDNLKKRD